MVREPLDADRRRLLTAIARNPAMTRLDPGLVAIVVMLLPMIGCAGLAGGSLLTWIGASTAAAALIGACFYDRARWRRAVVACLSEELADRRIGEIALPDTVAPRDPRWPQICELLRRTAARDAGDGRLRRSCEILQHALAGRLDELDRLAEAEAFDERLDPTQTGPAGFRLRGARREAEEGLGQLLDALRRLHAEANIAGEAANDDLELVQSELARFAAAREIDVVARARPVAVTRAL